jgi:hypothetical protein
MSGDDFDWNFVFGQPVRSLLRFEDVSVNRLESNALFRQCHLHLAQLSDVLNTATQATGGI